jgi:hypothetical protein
LKPGGESCAGLFYVLAPSREVFLVFDAIAAKIAILAAGIKRHHGSLNTIAATGPAPNINIMTKCNNDPSHS